MTIKIKDRLPDSRTEALIPNDAIPKTQTLDIDLRPHDLWRKRFQIRFKTLDLFETSVKDRNLTLIEPVN